ncbi:hypothetical protein [Streptomyces sp. Ag82_O1-15]|uniref:hypothetical protein n=1 Tax=Streptomyces sp. Ag82_O1-15 TaxID=1938855 RepID=UPI000BB14147|nr:hypothetical protein [Streptomyces sp. Ag82_O1-15]
MPTVAAYLLRPLACLALCLGEGVGGGLAVVLGFLLFVLGLLELLARLLHLRSDSESRRT